MITVHLLGRLLLPHPQEADAWIQAPFWETQAIHQGIIPHCVKGLPHLVLEYDHLPLTQHQRWCGVVLETAGWLITPFPVEAYP